MKEQNNNIPIANQYDKYCENLMFEIESEEYIDFDEDLEFEAYREYLMDLEDCENLMFEIESEEYIDFDEDLEFEAYREYLMDLKYSELSD